MPEPHFLFQKQGPIAILTINRPQAKNSISQEMVTLWRQALEGARDDDAIRAIVLTARGDTFCTGGNLQEMAAGKRRGWDMKRFLWDYVYPISFVMENLDKPVIAAVNGAAAGAGLDMALMCDLRICSEKSKFSASYINIGLVAGNGGAYYLPRLVGLGQALEILLTGDIVSAEEALRLGLVNRVVPEDRLLEESLKLAEKLASKPPLAVRMMKRAVYASRHSSLRGHLDFISSQLALLSRTDDHLEAVQAFLEKRTPVFKGK
ncbi:MAG: enoyl-CoA hydratase-related protein [Desulfobacterota bacterium]|nr:enoyl-CoA hydratase-related protein [Thermodesulfobacteriota bacterium]